MYPALDGIVREISAVRKHIGSWTINGNTNMEMMANTGPTDCMISSVPYAYMS